MENLPKYHCHKVVRAAKITGIGGHASMGATLSVDAPGGAIAVSADYCRKHNPQAGGYFVVYEDGYQSFSPADAFEAGYTLETRGIVWDESKSCTDPKCTIAVKHMHVPGGFTTPGPLEEGICEARTRYPVDPKERKRLLEVFTYHAPKGDQVQRYALLRAEAYNLAVEITELCPPGRERSLALTKLEEAVFFANAAIARGEA